MGALESPCSPCAGNLRRCSGSLGNAKSRPVRAALAVFNKQTFRYFFSASFLQRVGCVTRCVFQVAGDIVRLPFGLIQLAFALEFLVTRDLACAFLDGALRLLGETFHM